MGKVEIIMRRAEAEQVSETVLAAFGAQGSTIIEPTILEFSDLVIRFREQTVCHKGKLVPMTRREFSVLAYLARHPRWVFSSEQIYEAVWGEDGENCGTAVSSIVGQIRRKLTPEDPRGGYIHTVTGVGYKFEATES